MPHNRRNSPALLRNKLESILFRGYRRIFARPVFRRLNTGLLRLGLHGLGILNYQTDAISGEAAFIRRCAQDLNVVFDVGGNRGHYAERVLQTNPVAIVHAFEPHPETFQLLRRQLEPYGSHVVLNEAACGDTERTMTLFDADHHPGSATASLHRGATRHARDVDDAGLRSFSVRQITLDEYIRNHGIEHVDLLKIDTEGNELNVLKGSQQSLREGRIRRIQFEFNTMNIDSRVFFRDFVELLEDYTLYRLLPNGMIRLDYRPVLCEIFAFQNIVAERKKDR